MPDQREIEKFYAIARKRRRRVRVRLSTSFDCKGLLSTRGECFIRVQHEGSDDVTLPPALIPLREFQDPERVFTIMDKHNFFLPYPKLRNAFLEEVSRVRNFEEWDLRDRPGWDDDCFVLRNGDVISMPLSAHLEPEGESQSLPARRPEIAFSRAAGFCPQRGNTDVWQTKLPKLLVGQDILTFALVLGLVPTLLNWVEMSGNFAVEIVGGAACGKTTASKLAAATWGLAIGLTRH